MLVDCTGTLSSEEKMGNYIKIFNDKETFIWLRGKINMYLYCAHICIAYAIDPSSIPYNLYECMGTENMFFQ
jgi:hypothetical protein